MVYTDVNQYMDGIPVSIPVYVLMKSLAPDRVICAFSSGRDIFHSEDREYKKAINIGEI